MENVNGELLINLVRSQPYLFNKTDKRYKDIRIKENVPRYFSNSWVGGWQSLPVAQSWAG
jgi:hypothetical protein